MDRPKFQIAAACGLAVLLASSGCRGTPSRQVPPEQPYASPTIAPGGGGYGPTTPAGVNYGSTTASPTTDPYNTGAPATSPYGDYGAPAAPAMSGGVGTAPPLDSFPTTGAGGVPTTDNSPPAVDPASEPAQYNVGDPGAGPSPL